jgi:hypothetical protein
MAPGGRAYSGPPVRLGLPTLHVKAWHFIPPSHLSVFHKPGAEELAVIAKASARPCQLLPIEDAGGGHQRRRAGSGVRLPPREIGASLVRNLTREPLHLATPDVQVLPFSAPAAAARFGGRNDRCE